MKDFCKTLRKHAERIIYWKKKKEIIPSTDKESKSYENQNIATYAKKGLLKIIKSKRSLPFYRKI